jgi:hypothetical protein
MFTRTIAQGPQAHGGRYITIGSTIYHLEIGDDPASYPAPLKALLDAEALDAAADRELQNITARMRARLRAQNGVPVVPAHAVMRAALSLGVLAAVETWITNNKASNPLALRLAYGAESITQAELVSVSPAQGANIFAAALAL